MSAYSAVRFRRGTYGSSLRYLCRHPTASLSSQQLLRRDFHLCSPLSANRALSPPDDPPLLVFRLNGLLVYPQTLLYDSGIIIAVGTFLRGQPLSQSRRASNLRLAEDESSLLPHDTRHDALLLRRRRIIGPRYKPHRRVGRLDVEVILERHGETMQRSDRLARLGKVLVQLLGPGQSLREEDLSETVGLRLSAMFHASLHHLQAAERSLPACRRP